MKNCRCNAHLPSRRGSLWRLVSVLEWYDLKSSKVSGTNHALSVLLCEPGVLSGRCPERLLSYAGLLAPTFVNFCNWCSHFLTLLFKSLLLFPVTSMVHQSPFIVFFPLSCVFMLPDSFIWHSPVFLGYTASALLCTATTTKSKLFSSFWLANQSHQPGVIFRSLAIYFNHWLPQAFSLCL